MRYATTLVLTSLLAACGGGGGGSPAPVTAPAATPTLGANPNPGSGTPLSGTATGPRQASGWGPAAVANALQFPVQSGFNGSGFTVAIIAASNINSADLAAYFTFFSIPRTLPVSVQFIDNAPQTVTSPESTLDVETIAALAPGAKVTLYVVPALSSVNINDALNAIVSARAANVVSMSFGGCEIGNMSEGGEDALFQAGGSAGIAFVASAGDHGNDCEIGGSSTNLQFGVGYPGSDPNVIAVGGTEVASATGITTLTSTTAWNDANGQGRGQGATGGGVSSIYPLPSYQTAVSGAASARFRNTPDVAMPAVDDAIYYNGVWQLVDGTSWSAPMFAAQLSEVYEYCNTAFNDAVNIPYTVFAAKGYGAFIDVTSGNNQYRSTTPFYFAQTGYDNTSGIGVPLGMPLAQGLCPNRVPISRARMTRASSAATRRSAQAFTADVTPHISGLHDRGERDANAATRVQLVLQPSAMVAGDEQQTIATLEAAGLTVVKTFPNHLVVDAQGPTAAIEQLFGTKLHDVDEGRFGTHYLPVVPITVPQSLAPFVAGINLDDVVTMTGG